MLYQVESNVHKQKISARSHKEAAEKFIMIVLETEYPILGDFIGVNDEHWFHTMELLDSLGIEKEENESTKLAVCDPEPEMVEALDS